MNNFKIVKRVVLYNYSSPIYVVPYCYRPILPVVIAECFSQQLCCFNDNDDHSVS